MTDITTTTDLDPVVQAMVDKLPRKDEKWTKAEIEAWLDAFDAILKYVHVKREEEQKS